MHLHNNKASADCSICLDDIDFKTAKLLSCGHYFHEACWNTLVRRHHQCPICRSSMISDMKNVTTWFVTVYIDNNRQSFEIPLNKYAESFVKTVRVKRRAYLLLNTMISYYEEHDEVPLSDSFELNHFSSKVWMSMQVGPFHMKYMTCLRDTPLAMQMALYQPDFDMNIIAKRIKEWMTNYFNEYK